MASVNDFVSKSTELVSLPDIYFIVKSLLEDSTATLVDVADVLSTDPSLTARCLKLVNSAMYSLNAPVETVSRAISLLGATQIHDMVLTSSVAGAVARLPISDTFSLQRFWQKSLCRAATAQCLAKQCNVLDAERLFVAGLLSDIGHLIMYCQEPQLTGQAERQAAEVKQPLAAIERTIIGCDYTQVGSSLMREWALPQSLIEAAEFQLEPALAVKYPLEVAIVHIAIALADSNVDRTENWSTEVHASAWEITGLDTSVAELIESEINERLADATGLLAPARRRAG